MKLLLDMYRSAPKEQRDKVQLMAAEKKAKSEVYTWLTLLIKRQVKLRQQALCAVDGFN